MTAIATKLRTDREVQEDVLNELRWDPQVEPTELGVIVNDGVVTLTGWVDTYLMRMAAQHAAHRVAGVTAVANEIVVRLASAAERSDMDIAAAAVRALEWDAAVPIEKIDVTVSKGWVTLQGEVTWQFQKEAAERVIHRLAGVRGVSNILMVTPRLDATGIKEQIEGALVRSAETDAGRIKVTVEGSKIILTGRVRSFAERRTAERSAWSAPGVTAVDNQLVITF